MSGEAPANLLVMLSGTGRTLEYLCDAIQRGELRARIPTVVASRECPGAEKARRRGLETLVREGGIDATELDGIVASRGIDWVVLAGYLKLLPHHDRVRGRVLNIHPALLPRFGGRGMHGDRVHEEVLAAHRRGEASEIGVHGPFRGRRVTTRARSSSSGGARSGRARRPRRSPRAFSSSRRRATPARSGN